MAHATLPRVNANTLYSIADFILNALLIAGFLHTFLYTSQYMLTMFIWPSFSHAKMKPAEASGVEVNVFKEWVLVHSYKWPLTQELINEWLEKSKACWNTKSLQNLKWRDKATQFQL